MQLSAGDAGDAGDEGDEGSRGKPETEGVAGPAGATGNRSPRADDPGELRIDVRRTGPVRIVSVEGELDRDSAHGLRTALAGLSEDGVTRILVDLTGLGFCDSTGLNVLLRARQDAEPAGVALELAGLRPAVVRLFAVTGADTVLRIHPSVAAALAADGGPAGPTGPTGSGRPDDLGPAAREQP
ncbi:STAS domain-containing protein [Kitasatospora sp. NPDC094019]|uniref:STAS domain-containing protein n=1 Tax=Kitasatospora sp. NPDC094019 TaxID=3364091 RepID=UPI00380BE4F1